MHTSLKKYASCKYVQTLYVYIDILSYCCVMIFHCVLFFWTETGISSGTGDYDHMVKCGARLCQSGFGYVKVFEIAENHQNNAE